MNYSLPHQPGVYFFKNNTGSIIYIGKAQSLHERVRSYFGKQTSWKTASLLQELDHINVIVTKSEIEAALLEAELIKLYQPKYNILLKDGQPYLYLKFTKANVTVVRNKKGAGTYIGPFLSKTAARKVHHFLLQTFQLATCNKKIANGCLKYHIGLCAGNCRKDFDQKAYEARLALARQALTITKSEDFIEDIRQKIAEHNARLEFEQARQLHEYLQSVQTIMQTLHTRYNFEQFVHRISEITNPVFFKAKTTQLEHELQQLLQLNKPIKSIDCFDISHFQSHSIVGSCVRFVEGVIEKEKLRRFKIKSLNQQNDYAALQEIVTRRYKEGDLPDIVLIDGGKGQLNAVASVIPQAICISLAKREERLFTANIQNGIVLDIHSPVGKLLISLRDYAHHFAITYHRLLQKKHLKKR